MPPATLAMAPVDSLRFTSRNKTDRAAQAAAFELVGGAAHRLISLCPEANQSNLSLIKLKGGRAVALDGAAQSFRVPII
jgi:hypothetical protein